MKRLGTVTSCSWLSRACKIPSFPRSTRTWSTMWPACSKGCATSPPWSHQMTSGFRSFRMSWILTPSLWQGWKASWVTSPTLGRPQRLAQSWKTWKVSWLLWLLWAKCRKAPETGLPSLPSLLRLLQCLANRPQRLPRLTPSPPLHQKLRTRPWRTGAHRSIIPIYYNIARSFRHLLGIRCTTSCSCWSETTMNGLKGWLIGQPAP